MDPEGSLRQWLTWQLEGGGAHAAFRSVVEDFPAQLQGKRPDGLPYSAWELLEHMRIVQADIIDFCTDPGYVALQWPTGYWPSRPEPPDALAWIRTMNAYLADRSRMVDLVKDTRHDLHAPIPHGNGQTLLREVLLLADHESYHLGQLVVVRRLLGAWDAT